MRYLVFPFAAVALENVLAVLSAVVGFVAAASGTWVSARQSRETRQAVEQVRASRPDAAIASLDLKALGDYIYGTLGSIPIAEYASNESARGDVARALDDIEHFVAEDEPLAEGQRDDELAKGSLVAARQALAQGDSWQALALLRRAIEIDLRDLAARNGVGVPPRVGAGRLLHALDSADVLPAEIAGPLRYAIDVANRAIHGEDISPGMAEEALYTADRVLRQLRAGPGTSPP